MTFYRGETLLCWRLCSWKIRQTMTRHVRMFTINHCQDSKRQLSSMLLLVMLIRIKLRHGRETQTICLTIYFQPTINDPNHCKEIVILCCKDSRKVIKHWVHANRAPMNLSFTRLMTTGDWMEARLSLKRIANQRTHSLLIGRQIEWSSSRTPTRPRLSVNM